MPAIAPIVSTCTLSWMLLGKWKYDSFMAPSFAPCCNPYPGTETPVSPFNVREETLPTASVIATGQADLATLSFGYHVPEQ